MDNKDPIRVLVADDEPMLRRSVVRMLANKGMHVSTAEDGARAIELMVTEPFDVALVDLMMPRVGGLEVLEHIRSRYPDVEVIIMTAFGDVETAVHAVQSGAFSFITKPFRSNDEVGLLVEQAAGHRSLKARAERLERQLGADDAGFGRLVGSSPKMQEVYNQAMAVAATKASVLILGESGTGKELTAQAIHENSLRKNKAFLAINCSTIPEGLIDSELFGHVKGAFTNATAPRTGLFEAANHGTLFLDEVGDLPLQSQVRLLRVLQEGEVRRVGSNDTIPVDVRLIAATKLDLKRKINDGTFREDLYYRLNVVEINLPPLRERREDIPGLAYHFLHKHARKVGREVRGISPEAVELLCAHPWNGNVRELENAIQRAIVFCGEEILPSNLPFTSSVLPQVPARETEQMMTLSLPAAVGDLEYKEAKGVAIQVFEQHYFAYLRDATQGNLSEASRRAGLDRSNFRRALRRAGVKWRDEQAN